MKCINFPGYLGKKDNKNYCALKKIFSNWEIESVVTEYETKTPAEVIEEIGRILVSGRTVFVGQSLGGLIANKLSLIFQIPCLLTNPVRTISGVSVIDRRLFHPLLWTWLDTPCPCNRQAYVLTVAEDEVLGSSTDDEQRYGSVREVAGSHSNLKNLEFELKLELTRLLKSKYIL